MHKTKEIVIIAPQELLSETAKSVVSQSSQNDVEIVDAYLDRAENLATRAEKDGAQVLLSLPFTAHNIRKCVKIPVLEIEIDPFNLLEALFEASKTSNKIAYLGLYNDNIKYDFQGFIEILGRHVTIAPFYYQTRGDISEKAIEAMKAGMESAVVTGKCVKQRVEEAGLSGFMIEVSPESVRDAITRAREIVSVQKKEKEKRKTLQTILDMTNDGIISVDANHRINLINKSSERILGISASEIVGLNVDELDNAELKCLVTDCSSNQEKIYVIKNKKLIVSKSEFNSDLQGSIIAFRDITEIQKMEQVIRNELASKGLVAKYNFSDIIGESSAIKQAIRLSERIAKNDLDVLIIGETGSGKELFSNSIHNASARKKGPFVAINCATLPESLLESELFGYENGAFTGAKKGGKPGLFELAHGGILFLDEIGDLPLPLQPRLLRVLQEKEVRRISGEKIIPVDVRIVAATNANLFKLVNENKFRADLYYRLSTLKVNIPPLRERKEDLEKIIEFLLRKKLEINNVAFSREIIEIFKEHNWPGNVRELENIIVRLMLFSEDELSPELVRRLIFEEVSQNEGQHEVFDVVPESVNSVINQTLTGKTVSLDEIENRIIKELINKDMSKAEVANYLGISRTTLWRKMKSVDRRAVKTS